MDRRKALIDSRKYAEKVKKRFPECRVIMYGSYEVGGQAVLGRQLELPNPWV